MSDRYHEECQRREKYAPVCTEGEVDLLVPEHVLLEVEAALVKEPNEPKVYTGLYL